VKALTAVRARYRRVAASADGGFLGFPELARGIAAVSGSKVYTDQARRRMAVIEALFEEGLLLDVCVMTPNSVKTGE
jgi:hypothetical protein